MIGIRTSTIDEDKEERMKHDWQYLASRSVLGNRMTAEGTLRKRKQDVKGARY
jgi:hypothetical protein